MSPAATIVPLAGRRTSPAQRTREFAPGWIAVTVLGLAAAMLAPALLLFLLVEGAAFLAGPSADTLFSLEWHPREGSFGLTPLLLGTLSSAGLGLLLALPISIGTAVHLRYFAGRRTRRPLETVLGVLAGTPSVVFGLFATFWIVPNLGATLASGVLVLAIMITPTLALLSLGVLRQVPEDLLRDGARLGLRREQTILRLALVRARPGILAAAALALARALGEALAVEMVCGNVPNLPTSLTTPVRTLTTTLVQEFEYAQETHAQALHLVALAVVALAALACGIGQRLARRGGSA